MKKSVEVQTIFFISYRVETISEVQIEDRVGIETLAALIMNF